jgi:ABC-type transport system involved in multi-copper enzyme maturation permease subunit
LFVGPVFTREVVTAPRRDRLFWLRGVYVLALGVLMAVCWQVLNGTQPVRSLSDYARFGAFVFELLAALQLALAMFFSAVLAASAVAQEKDKKTFVLLLLTRLSNQELVLGRLAASLLNVLMLVAAGLPVLLFTVLFGGVSFAQVARALTVTLATAIAAGSIGSTVALWREKTFQTLAIVAVLLVVWLAAGEALRLGVAGPQGVEWAAVVSPWQAIVAASSPLLGASGQAAGWLHGYGFALTASLVAVVANGLAIGLVRVWNPSREAAPRQEESPAQESIWGAEFDASRPEGTPIDQPAAQSAHAAPGRVRQVWDNPVLWREICTWAYGRKTLAVRLGYLMLAGLAAAGVVVALQGTGAASKAAVSLALAPLFILSLVLINALAVTSLTTERDGKALDLLLVTDITAKEFVFGKLWGVFFNAKEMVVLPLLLCGYLWWAGQLDGENLTYLLLGLLVMNLFAAVLGLHAGMSYDNSRSAIAVSLGTVFFLFLGVAICMRIMVAFPGEFVTQLAPFTAIVLAGGLGLYAALGYRNPSPAIKVASFLTPFFTFWAITSFLLNFTLSVFLVIVGTYGFATLAMLVPAIYEFDVATGRTTAEE